MDGFYAGNECVTYSPKDLAGPKVSVKMLVSSKFGAVADARIRYCLGIGLLT